MIRACIFDLDGVIVDTAIYHFVAWKNLAASLGIEFTEKNNEKLKGVGRMESLDYILSLGQVQKNESEMLVLAHNKNEHYKSLISSLTEEAILPGIKVFFDELKEAGVFIALGSSSKNARPVLENIGLKSYFDVIVDGTNISRSKPDPEVFELGAQALEIPPVEIIVFEDAQAGIDAAKTGGFKCVGVGSAEELSGADILIPGFEGLTYAHLLNQLKQ